MCVYACLSWPAQRRSGNDQRPAQLYMERYCVKKGAMHNKHKDYLMKHAFGKTLVQEVHDALAYCKKTIQRGPWMVASGTSAHVLATREVKTKLGAMSDKDSGSVVFGGTLGMLRLDHRIHPVVEMDLGRMRWACERLDQEGKISKLLHGVVVCLNGDEGLKWVERDADIDVVMLSIYWHKPSKEEETHKLMFMCQDIVYHAENFSNGLALSVERFKRMTDEQKIKDVMGRSPWRLSLDMQGMVKMAETGRAGRSDGELLAATLATRPELRKEWSVDTCRRYLYIAGKLDANSIELLGRWELLHQRRTLVDTFSVLRACASAAPCA